MLALGRRYGLVGRNGTGKTTFLRALASKSIKGIPDNVQASLSLGPGSECQGMMNHCARCSACLHVWAQRPPSLAELSKAVGQLCPCSLLGQRSGC